jgi:fructose-bisphosphate aldolase class II
MSDTMRLPPGVVTGDLLSEVFEFCKEVGCAIPAVNVVGSHGVNAAMQAAREAQSPIIVQFSSGGAHFFAGKSLDDSGSRAAVAGAVAGAQHVRAMAEAYGVPVVVHTDHAARRLLPWVEGMLGEGERHFEKTGRPLFSSHMLDLSEEPLKDNLQTCESTLRRIARIGMTLEIELGITGGEEDGVDHSRTEAARLYTRPVDVLAAYDRLRTVGAFTVAAAFGNTHGVYKPGNVQLRPTILRDSQSLIQSERQTPAKPVNFVFHGGSGSSLDEIREAVSYGVVKMNIDTDTQWAFTHPIKQYMDERDGYLHSQVGNPDGADRPNKKHIDPRVWLHLGERGMTARLVQAFRDLNSYGKFSF